MKSKTLDIIALCLLTGSAAYKVATVKSFILGFHKQHLSYWDSISRIHFLQLRSANSVSLEMSVLNSEVMYGSHPNFNNDHERKIKIVVYH